MTAWLGIFALALALRLVFVALFRIEPWADMLWNDAVGWNLAMGHGFTASQAEPRIPGVFRTPGYPAMLAAVYYTFGHSHLAAYVAQAVVDAGSALLVGLVAREVVAPRLAILGAVLYALYPYPAILCGILQQDILLTAAVLIVVLLTLRASRAEAASAWLVAGVATGLAALVKANFLAFVVVPAIVALARDAPWRRRVAWTLAVVLGLMLAVGPWLVRNYVVFEAVPPLAVAGTGTNVSFLLEAVAPARAPTLIVHGKRYPSHVVGGTLDGPDLIAAERTLVERGVPELIRHWPAYLRHVMRGLPWLWLSHGDFGRGPLVSAGAVILSWLVVVLGIIGIVRTRRAWRRLLPLYLTMGIITLMYAPIRVEGRYTLPARAVMLAFVAAALIWLTEPLRRRILEERA